MNRYLTFGILLTAICVALGCGSKTAPSKLTVAVSNESEPTAVRLHFEGFTKSNSGAT